MRKSFFITVLTLAVISGHGKPETTPTGQVIPGQFIVTVAADAAPEAVIATYGIHPRYTYHAALNGFSAALSDAERTRLLNDQRIKHIEPDGIVVAQDTQANPDWGLDRIDQARLPLDSSYTYGNSGQGVTVYVIDSGIRSTHVEFGGRVTFGYDAYGGQGETCNNHGTGNAGSIGGATFGVAKEVSLVSVKVLNCSGSSPISAAIAGIDWVAAHHAVPAVANLSIGYGASATLDVAVQNLIFSGVTVAVAASNDNRDACNYSPARVSDAITVGNSQSNDARNSTSNWGTCVDFFAPGTQILSAAADSDTATLVGSGTSRAAPFVSGVAALYLQNHPLATPIDVRDALLSFATKNVITDANTPNNHLVSVSEIVQGNGDYASPTVAMTNPSAGSEVPRNKTITIESVPRDNVNITKVDFYVAGGFKCTDTTAPFSCAWKVPGGAPGVTYLLQSKAYDAAGNVGSSPFVSVTGR